MAESWKEDRGESRTGPRLEDAFKALSLASKERLLSLTLKLDQSQAEELVQALSLIILKKGREALEKLQSLKNSNVARYLEEMLNKCGNRLEDFCFDGQNILESQVDTLTDLARIFKVLAEEGLCCESKRDQAYQAVLRACGSKTGSEARWENQHVKRLVEEAREVCGPPLHTSGMHHFLDPEGRTLKSPSGLCSFLPFGYRGSPTIRIEGGQFNRSGIGNQHGSPSSLRTICPSKVSFPSHLEVSASPTTLFHSQIVNSGTQNPHSILSEISNEEFKSTHSGYKIGDRGEEISSCLSSVLSEVKPKDRLVEDKGNITVSAPPASSQLTLPLSPLPSVPCSARKDQSQQCPNNPSRLCQQIVTPKGFDTKLNQTSSSEQVIETIAPDTGTYKSLNQTYENISINAPSLLKVETHEKWREVEQEEEEAQFFSFVILHAPEDLEVAEELQEKLEGLGIVDGAIFSEDFAVPGRPTLSCVEDAINNSAFTILLLSCNFNTRLLEFKANSALMNSIENQYKYNTVIPYLPLKNCMPPGDIPKSLRMFVALEEKNKRFDRMAKKALSPENIRRQKKLWSADQRMRAQREKLKRLRREKERHEFLAKEAKEVSQLEQNQRQFPNPAMPQHLYWPGTQMPPQHQPLNTDCQLNMALPSGHQPTNIHIQNASYIMIGNDSQMTVGIGAESPGDEAVGCGREETHDGQNEDRPLNIF